MTPRGVFVRTRKPKESSIDDPASIVAPVRENIKMMTGFSTEESMAENLPENTNDVLGEESRPKRKYTRRTKAEMAAARSEGSTDPLMSDQVYRDAIADMAGWGGASLSKSLFKLSGKPLEAIEERRVDGMYYVASKKWPEAMDPTRSPIAFSIYAAGLYLQLIFVRLDMVTGENGILAGLKSLFTSEKKEEESKEPNGEYLNE